jgi:hypothetical protein
MLQPRQYCCGGIHLHYCLQQLLRISGSREEAPFLPSTFWWSELLSEPLGPSVLPCGVAICRHSTPLPRCLKSRYGHKFCGRISLLERRSRLAPASPSNQYSLSLLGSTYGDNSIQVMLHHATSSFATTRLPSKATCRRNTYAVVSQLHQSSCISSR